MSSLTALFTSVPDVRSRAHRRFAFTVLVAQAVLLALSMYHHKPWFDEAQAWLLARDSSPLDLLVHHLRYEGSPGLWHLLLMVPAKLGLPYGSMGVIAIGANLAGSAMLLWRAPLPRGLTVLVCFSFFVFFQYGVVARSYCLLAPLLFLLAMGWRDKLRHPVRTTVLLCVLANVSLHGLLIALALSALYADQLRHVWRTLSSRELRRQLTCLAAFAVVVLTVVAELVPPADLTGGGSWHVSAPWDLLASRLVTPQLLVVIFTFAVVGATMWWFYVRKCLLTFVLPAGAVSLLFMFRYFSPWHMGALFLVWVFALWVSMDRPAVERRSAQRVQTPVMVAVGLAMAGQVGWTLLSVQYDWTHSYSGSAEAAGYIEQQGLQDRRIDVIGKWGIGILPYFARDIFHNYNHGRGPSYYPWTALGPITGRTSDVLLDRPDVIVVSVKSRDGATRLPCLPGFREEKRFPGGIYWPGGVMETESFALYVRDPVGGEQLLWGDCGRL